MGKDKKENYTIGCTILGKIGCILAIFFLLILSFNVIIDAFSKTFSSFLLMLPIGILCFGAYTYLGYKLELSDMLIVREKFSLKTLKIDYKELEKYKNDEDFLFGVLNSWAKLKIGDKKYISIPIEKEDSFIFLDGLFKKIGIEDFSKVKINLIPRDVKVFKSILLSFAFTIIYITFMILVGFDYLSRIENISKVQFKNVFFFINIEYIIGFIIIASKINLVSYKNEFQKHFLEERGRKIRKVMIYTFIYVFVFYIVKSIG